MFYRSRLCQFLKARPRVRSLSAKLTVARRANAGVVRAKLDAMRELQSQKQIAVDYVKTQHSAKEAYLKRCGIANASETLERHSVLLTHRSLTEVKDLVHLLSARCVHNCEVAAVSNESKAEVRGNGKRKKSKGNKLTVAELLQRTPHLLDIDPLDLASRLNALYALLNDSDSDSQSKCEMNADLDFDNLDSTQKNAIGTVTKRCAPSASKVEQCMDNLIRCSEWQLLCEASDGQSQTGLRHSECVSKLRLLVEVLSRELKMSHSQWLSVLNKCPWVVARDVNFVLMTLRELEEVFSAHLPAINAHLRQRAVALQSPAGDSQIASVTTTDLLRRLLLTHPLALSVSLYHLKKVVHFIGDSLPQPQCSAALVLHCCPQIVGSDLNKVKQTLLFLTNSGVHNSAAMALFRVGFEGRLEQLFWDCPKMALLKSAAVNDSLQFVMRLLGASDRLSMEALISRLKQLRLFHLFLCSPQTIQKRVDYLRTKHAIQHLAEKHWPLLVLDLTQIDATLRMQQ